MVAEEPTLKIMKILKKWIGYFARKELPGRSFMK
jgi:hypothetical protein